jgi:hypothetical protein
VKIGLGIILYGLLFGSLLANPATAALLQFSFTGVVNDVPASLFPAINNGQTLFGSLTIDTSIPGSNPSASISLNTNAITSLTISLGPTNGALVPPNATTGLPANNSIGIQKFATFGLYSMEGPLSGSSVNGLSPIGFEFAGDALPAAHRVFLPYISNQGRLNFSGAGNPIRGSLSSITEDPVPVSVILFCTGLVALVGLGAGNWRQRKNGIA